jgi:hypothetical protein
MATPQDSQERSLRAWLQKLLDERGDLFHLYSSRIANPNIDLAEAMRDLAIENARIDGSIAALFIEHGRPADDELKTEAAGAGPMQRAHETMRNAIDGALDAITGLPAGWTGLM